MIRWRGCEWGRSHLVASSCERPFISITSVLAPRPSRTPQVLHSLAPRREYKLAHECPPHSPHCTRLPYCPNCPTFSELFPRIAFIGPFMRLETSRADCECGIIYSSIYLNARHRHDCYNITEYINCEASNTLGTQHPPPFRLLRKLKLRRIPRHRFERQINTLCALIYTSFQVLQWIFCDFVNNLEVIKV